MQGFTSILRREPIGIAGLIAPWNYPLYMAAWKLGPALAAGNCVVIKPSEMTPMTLVRFAELVAEKDVFPPGVFNVVTGDGVPVGERIVTHPDIGIVSLTGETSTGKLISKLAADTLKRTHLELGGKAPVIIFDDADLATAAEWIKIAGFFNSGQDCTAATRVLVQAGIHDEFVAALAEAAKGMPTGMPDDEATYYGPLNNANQLAHVTGMVDRLPDHATIQTGGARKGDRGYFYEPTVLSGLQQQDEQIQTEIFGPVMTVQKFADEAEALRWANDVQYALSSSVWTRDHARALRMSRRLDFGAVWINTHIPFVSEMPHGGFKHSGYGKDLSGYGFEDYTRIKHVMSYIGE
jgi:betaine-aldehyde dehydrogenase